ncbi:MAG: FHA domain-containing protein [Burkholderiales bacterium]|nr:FHA domain-containing protein [Burkholderiales bacterium]
MVELTRELQAARSSYSSQRDSVSRQDERLADLDRLVRAAEARDADHEATLRAATALHDEIEGLLAAEKARANSLAADLADAHAALAERDVHASNTSEALRSHGERALDLEQRERELAAKLAERDQAQSGMHAELQAATTRAGELQQDLQAAEDQLNRLEAELRARQLRIDELTAADADVRTQLAGTRRKLEERDALIGRIEAEAASSAAVLGSIRESMQRIDPLAATGSEMAHDGLARLLSRVDGPGEVVHVLGRKTTVGRTPDNDLQINAKFISRHHAVILAGPTLTIVEDLNSTNGVYVNGRRIMREALADGDQLTIGKAKFRFSVRPVARTEG